MHIELCMLAESSCNFVCIVAYLLNFYTAFNYQNPQTLIIITLYFYQHKLTNAFSLYLVYPTNETLLKNLMSALRNIF